MKIIAMVVITAGIAQGVMATENYKGRISIQGAVVKDACSVELLATQLQVTCGSNNERQNTLMALSTLDVLSLPTDSTYTVSNKWLDKEKSEAVVTIEYK